MKNFENQSSENEFFENCEEMNISKQKPDRSKEMIRFEEQEENMHASYSNDFYDFVSRNDDNCYCKDFKCFSFSV